MGDIQKADKQELREIRFYDDMIKNLDSAFYILPDSLIILKANEKEQLGIYIKEESTAKLQRKIFEILWKQANRHIKTSKK